MVWKFWNQCKFQQRILILILDRVPFVLPYRRTSGMMLCRLPYSLTLGPFKAARHTQRSEALVGLLFRFNSQPRQNSILCTTVHPLSLLPLHSTSYSNLCSAWQLPSGLRSEQMPPRRAPTIRPESSLDSIKAHPSPPPDSPLPYSFIHSSHE